MLDLSRHTARFTTLQAVGDIGDDVELFLPGESGSEIGIEARIVRLTPMSGGQGTEVAFLLVEPRSQRALERLLGLLLAGTGGGSRRHPRIAYRMPITLERPPVRAILEEVSRGGIGLSMAHAMTLEEVVTVRIPDLDGKNALTVDARVVNQRPSPHADGDLWYRVGMELVDLTPVMRASLDSFIRTLVMTGPRKDACSESAQQPRESGGADILLVDDDQEVRAAIRRALEESGHRIHEAHSGEQGLEILQAEKIDLVIADYCLPNMDGLAFVDRAHAMAEDVLAIMLTGRADLSLCLRALNSGTIWRLLLKPWMPPELDSTIQLAAMKVRENRRDRRLLRFVRSDPALLARAQTDGTLRQTVRPGQVGPGGVTMR